MPSSSASAIALVASRESPSARGSRTPMKYPRTFGTSRASDVDRPDEQLGLEPAPQAAVPDQERVVRADALDGTAHAGPRAPRRVGGDAEGNDVDQVPQVGVGAVRRARHAPRAGQHPDPVVALALARAEEEVSARDLRAQELQWCTGRADRRAGSRAPRGSSGRRGRRRSARQRRASRGTSR